MNPPFGYLADPSHAAAGFWVLLGSGVLDLLGLALLAIVVWRGMRWVWREARAVAGPWVSLLALLWSTRPVRRCVCCRDAQPQFQTRAEVFGPLGEFGPYRMPRREPQHVPPQVLPSPPVSPWPDEPCFDEPADLDEPAEFAEAADIVPLSLDEWLEQCRAEYESGRWRGDAR